MIVNLLLICPLLKWILDSDTSYNNKVEVLNICAQPKTYSTKLSTMKTCLQVQLVRYNPDELDSSILWSESKDIVDGYRAVRMINNIRLNVDAFHGDKDHGGVHDGTTIVLWEWAKGDNQQWRITPYRKFINKQDSRIWNY